MTGIFTTNIQFLLRRHLPLQIVFIIW